MNGDLASPGTEGGPRRGCGPLIPPLSESMRPLRQQIFERVRAGGLMPRVQVAKELGVSPASVTTLTSELIEMGLLEEVAVPREPGDTGRGQQPAGRITALQAQHAGIRQTRRLVAAAAIGFALLLSLLLLHSP